MSTILQAMQKNSLEQVTNSALVSKQPQYWKVAVSIALFIIIALLSTLIYLQVVTQQPLLSGTQPTTSNNLVRVSFDTQALPEPLPKEQPIEITAIENTPRPQPKVEQPVIEIPTPIVNDEVVDDVKTEQDIDYEQIPNDLKERFELALLLEDIEENQGNDDIIELEEEASDGSDIRQMSSNFQHKVAPISYEAHMYSSKLEDRWIRINGEELKEGQFDSSGELELIEIQPQRSIFRVQRQSFSLESLTDWQGY